MPLTRQQRLQIAATPTTEPTSITAPIGGWNTRDAVDAMEPTDAITLDNWYPDFGGCSVRNGFQSFATGMGTGAVQTLAEYSAGSADKLLAAANGKIFDASAGGAISSSLGSGFTSNWWQTVNFNGRLFLVNGADTAQVYDGTSLGAATFTGVTLSTLAGVAVYQQRLFFWQNNSTGFYYGGLNAISGALTFYDLSMFSGLGGNLMAVTTISHDGGDGVDDFICFIMSSGDVFIFFGNDPGTASTWALVGRYRISPPVGPRAVAKYGAEAFLTTADDHVPLQQQLVALKLGQLPPRSKICGAVQAAVKANAGSQGWQALYYPLGRRLIFNVPNGDGTFDQHVCNTAMPGAPWCRFTGMNASCWGLYKGGLYFGGNNGTVYQADTGNLDLLQAIQADGQQAWNTLQSPNRKRATAVRPIVQSVGPISYAFGVGFDYSDINVPVAASTPAAGSPWDTSPWDTSPWSPESQIDTRWRIGGGTGQAVGFRLNVSATQAVKWLRTDIRLEAGSAL